MVGVLAYGLDDGVPGGEDLRGHPPPRADHAGASRRVRTFWYALIIQLVLCG